VPSDREELLRRAFDAFNARDVDLIDEFVDPEVELITRGAALDGTSFRGHEGIKDWLRFLDEGWAEIVFHVDTVVDVGERMLATYRLRGRVRGPEIAIDQPASMVVDFREGRILRLKTYFDPVEALAAARLGGPS
jgi:ketosteroid isomerase-like protein